MPTEDRGKLFTRLSPKLQAVVAKHLMANACEVEVARSSSKAFVDGMTDDSQESDAVSHESFADPNYAKGVV